MPPTLFISYARKDAKIFERLRIGLAPLKRQGLIEVWYDKRIAAGSDWPGEIDKKLESAELILLLVSPDFLDSRWCYHIEMRRALERHKSGEAKTIPVLARPVPDLKNLPFANIQSLPSNGKAITEWPDRDQAFRDVVEGLKESISSLDRISAREPVSPEMPPSPPASPSLPPQHPVSSEEGDAPSAPSRRVSHHETTTESPGKVPREDSSQGPTKAAAKPSHALAIALILLALLIGGLYLPWAIDWLKPAKTATVPAHPPLTKMSGEELVEYLRPLPNDERYKQLSEVPTSLKTVLRTFYETDRDEFDQYVSSLNESQLSASLWSMVETIPSVQENFKSEEDFRKDPTKIKGILTHDQQGMLNQLVKLQRKAAAEKKTSP